MKKCGDQAARRRESALLFPPVYTQYVLPDLMTRARVPLARTVSARPFAAVLVVWQLDLVKFFPAIFMVPAATEAVEPTRALRFLAAPGLRRLVVVADLRRFAIAMLMFICLSERCRALPGFFILQGIRHWVAAEVAAVV